MSLDELDKIEQDLLSQIQKLDKRGGTIEEKTSQLEKNGIFKAYTQVHKSYIDLIKTGSREVRLEALKRALYIQWIGSFEPSFITGIITSFETYEINQDGLEKEDFELVYSILEKEILSGSMDTELNDMLGYYASWDFLFEWNGFDKFKVLNKFIKEMLDKKQNTQLIIRQRNLNNRGQMGEYFKEIGG